MDLERIILEELMAFIPIYVPLKGNCTQLYTKRGGIYQIDKSTKTVLTLLCQYYLMDLQAARKYYGDLLSMKNLIPIPFTEEDVFIPTKVRKPLYRNDGATGFINIRYIEKVVEYNKQVIIKLVNGETISSLSTMETVNRHIKNGHIVQRFYREKQQSLVLKEYDFYDEYSRPATKGDIALLRQEILKLKGL
ncbi:MAG: hypothetical protein GX023_06330 [Tissierellia bacterium]|nr:hypothetical protein [Tissierellia bacterium]